MANRGSTINEQAPVVALCANIVKDISGVAELKPETRLAYEAAVKATLAAFRKGSLVPSRTQVEILEALGQLGAAVKSHLIDATKASLFQVRSRAIEMLLPHLSDDELFAMEHVLDDRSKEPIKTLVRSWLERDPTRSLPSLGDLPSLGAKAQLAVCELALSFHEHWPSSVELCVYMVKNASPLVSRSVDAALVNWVIAVSNEQGTDEHIRRHVSSLAATARSAYLRRPIMEFVAEKWPDITKGSASE